jgi:hypothetical protein
MEEGARLAYVCPEDVSGVLLVGNAKQDLHCRESD